MFRGVGDRITVCIKGIRRVPKPYAPLQPATVRETYTRKYPQPACPVEDKRRWKGKENTSAQTPRGAPRASGLRSGGARGPAPASARPTPGPRPFPGRAPARPAHGRKRERGRTPDVKAAPPNLAQSQACKPAGAAAAAAATADRRGAGSSDPEGALGAGRRRLRGPGDSVQGSQSRAWPPRGEAAAWGGGRAPAAGAGGRVRRGPGGASAAVRGSGGGGGCSFPARGRWCDGPAPDRGRAASRANGDELPPRGSSALCGRGQMSEIWRRK